MVLYYSLEVVEATWAWQGLGTPTSRDARLAWRRDSIVCMEKTYKIQVMPPKLLPLRREEESFTISTTVLRRQRNKKTSTVERPATAKTESSSSSCPRPLSWPWNNFVPECNMSREEALKLDRLRSMLTARSASRCVFRRGSTVVVRVERGLRTSQAGARITSEVAVAVGSVLYFNMLSIMQQQGGRHVTHV